MAGLLAESCHLTVGSVAAVRTDEECVLADRRPVHELVRDVAAHHPRIAAYRNHGKTCPAEDPEIGAVVRGILPFEPGLVAVKRIRVLHGEFAHPNQAAARAWLVAELGLDLVDQFGQLAIRTDLLPRQISHDLLVGHRQQHVTPAAILEARHLRANRLPTPGLLPQLGRVDDGHCDLLPANPIHLLTNDPLDLIHRPHS